MMKVGIATGGDAWGVRLDMVAFVLVLFLAMAYLAGHRRGQQEALEQGF